MVKFIYVHIIQNESHEADGSDQAPISKTISGTVTARKLPNWEDFRGNALQTQSKKQTKVMKNCNRSIDIASSLENLENIQQINFLSTNRKNLQTVT